VQQRLLCPMMQRVGRFVEPLDSAHTLPTVWQRHLTKGVGQTCFCCLGRVSGQVYRARGSSEEEGRRLYNKKIIKEGAQTASCYW